MNGENLQMFEKFELMFNSIRHQAVIYPSDGLLSIGLLGTNFCEIWNK